MKKNMINYKEGAVYVQKLVEFILKANKDIIKELASK